MAEYLSGLMPLVMEELQAKSRKAIYRRDFQAWKADVLGFRTYEKMREIGDTALFGDKSRTMIKSANGTAKSFETACMIGWVSSVYEPGEAVSIVSAPSIPQLEKVTWAYLKSNFGRAAGLGQPMPGRIDESLGWVFDGPQGKQWLAFGRKPPEHDAVSTFQGIRSQYGLTYVFFDEAGGMSRPMFTAAEAVMTGSRARFIGIGNPDNTGTEFQRIFTDKTLAAEYNLFTIAAEELPTLTGERVYPHTPEGDAMEERMLASLTSRDWVEHKKRIWGEKDARYLSKVMGEFPGDGDNAFFPQRLITLAHETTIDADPEVRPVLGVDIARYGQDETVVYCNQGGRVRKLDDWGRTDAVETARRIHKLAADTGAQEVRVDSAGVGGPVFDILDVMEEFRNKAYLLIGIDGGVRSPDASRWANARAYNHDSLRSQLVEGTLDLDFEDRDLADQLLGVTFKFNNRGAIQITPKDEMRTVMDGSPDRLDALIYATLDTSYLFAPTIKPGDKVAFDPDVWYVDSYVGPGEPL